MPFSVVCCLVFVACRLWFDVWCYVMCVVRCCSSFDVCYVFFVDC